MNKRIIVGLDGSKFMKTTIEVACQIAKKSDGTVIGIGIIDLPGIKAIEKGAPLGTLYYAEKTEEHILKVTTKKVNGLLSTFESTCKKYKVKYELNSKKGIPFEIIVTKGKLADLIVIGLRTYFRFETTPKSDDTLKRVLKHSSCPVLAVPKKMKPPENILVAYDGSIHSARALRSFVRRLINPYKSANWTLLTLSDNQSEGKEIQNEALQYLKCWNINANTLILNMKPDEAILEQAKLLDPAIVIMGAFGKSKISEIFFGSTTLRLIEEGKIPLAIYH